MAQGLAGAHVHTDTAIAVRGHAHDIHAHTDTAIAVRGHAHAIHVHTDTAIAMRGHAHAQHTCAHRHSDSRAWTRT